MGTIPFPNIPQDAMQIAQAPQNALMEYQRMAQLKQQTALEQQQTAIAQQQAQQQQMATQDEQNARKLAPQYLQKDENGKVTGFDNEGYYNALIGTGMNPAKVNALRQQQLTYQQSLLTLNKDQLALQDEKNNRAYQIVEPIRQLTQEKTPDVNRINAAYQNVAPQLIQLGINPQHLPASFASPEDAAQKLQDFETELGQHKQLLADAKTTSETNAQNAKGRLDQAQAAHQEFINNLTANSKPGDFNTQIDQLYPPNDPKVAQLNQQTKSLVDGALQRGDLESARKVMDQAFQNVQGIAKDIAVQTNPEIQQGKVNVAAAEAGARQQAIINAEQAQAPSLDQITQTTRAGRKYIDASQLDKKVDPVIRQQAAQAGIPVVNKDQADALSQIDTAKANQQYMIDAIGKKLASGAPGRLWYGPANTIERMAQTDPEMAAVGTFRNAAIQSMRAVAGSKGLRINQAEIEMAIDNDIPKLTDTLPVAQAKLRNLQQFLENNEQSMLVRNRQQGGGNAGAQGGLPPGATHTGVSSVDHKRYYLDANGNKLGLVAGQ
jgi:hypothetical protein